MAQNEKAPEGAFRYRLIFATAAVAITGRGTVTVVTAITAMMPTATVATSALRFVNRLIVAVFFVVFLFAAFPNMALTVRRSSASATHYSHPLLIGTSTRYVGDEPLAWTSVYGFYKISYCPALVNRAENYSALTAACISADFRRSAQTTPASTNDPPKTVRQLICSLSKRIAVRTLNNGMAFK